MPSNRPIPWPLTNAIQRVIASPSGILCPMIQPSIAPTVLACTPPDSADTAGLPSNVVTPCAQVATIAGLDFSQFAAASSAGSW